MTTLDSNNYFAKMQRGEAPPHSPHSIAATRGGRSTTFDVEAGTLESG